MNDEEEVASNGDKRELRGVTIFAFYFFSIRDRKYSKLVC